MIKEDNPAIKGSRGRSRAAAKSAELFSKLVNPRFFAEATRESGYKGTPHAVAELVDNSIQAQASEIHIIFEDQADASDIWMYLFDNGVGMDADALEVALQFGGSTRFNKRDGIGRFGMGLPNASVSQARRLEVYTKRENGDLLYTYLDLDELADGVVSEHGFLTPITVEDWPIPAALKDKEYASGTLVLWKKCDRLNPRNFDAIKKKLTGHLGQTFRYYLYPMGDGGEVHRTITVNGVQVRPFDPLYLDPRAEWTGASERGKSVHTVAVPGRKGATSRVTVRYSILPIEDWQPLHPKEKNARRLTQNRGFSLVRNKREIEVTDRYFLIGKDDTEGRVMNNDSWWSCEISFGAELDEVFGVTHTKQEVRPNLGALQAVREEITSTIATLRSEYEQRRIKKLPNKVHQSEEIATQNDLYLPPVPRISQKAEEREQVLAEYLERTNREDESKMEAHARVLKKTYTVELESTKEGPFYRTAVLGDNTIVYINTDHPFYADIYSPLDEMPQQVSLELLLFALARGERQAGEEGKKWYQAQRAVWSAALRAYMTP